MMEKHISTTFYKDSILIIEDSLRVIITPKKESRMVVDPEGIRMQVKDGEEWHTVTHILPSGDILHDGEMVWKNERSGTTL